MTEPINARELVEDLQDGMASPVAQALREAVMAKDRKRAYACIREEIDYSTAQCKAVYDYLSKMLRGTDVTFEEVPKDKWSLLQDTIANYEDIEDTNAQESFLVRYGCDIFRAQPFKHRGEIIVYGQRSISIPFNKLDQVWRMIPK